VGSGGIDYRGFSRDHGVPTNLLDTGNRQRRRELVAGDYRPCVPETLITMHDTAEIDSSIGIGKKLRESALLNHAREGRGSDHVGVTSGTSSSWVNRDGLGTKDCASELANLFATHEVRLS